MKLFRHLLALAAGVVCAVGGMVARADIYKLVDADGSVTYSNIPPKDRSRIAEVFVSDPPPANAPPPGSVTRQSDEIRMLVERMDDLTRALEEERRANAAPPVAYPQYAAAAPPAWDEWGPGWGYGWNGGWNGGWFGPPFFVSSPVVISGAHNRFHHFKKFSHFPNSHQFGRGFVGSHPGFKAGTGFPAAGPRIPAFRAGFSTVPRGGMRMR